MKKIYRIQLDLKNKGNLYQSAGLVLYLYQSLRVNRIPSIILTRLLNKVHLQVITAELKEYRLSYMEASDPKLVNPDNI